MKLFNPKETSELFKLKEENDEFRNTIHQIRARQDDTADLAKKISEMTEKLSELYKEEQRVEDYLKASNDEKVLKSKSIFELKKQIDELTKQKEQLHQSIKINEETNDYLFKKKENTELEINELDKTVSNKKGELSKVEEKLNVLNNNANRLSDEVNRAENKVAELNKTAQELQKTVSENKAKIDNFEKTIEEKEKIQTKVEFDIDALSQSLIVLGEKKEILNLELENLESKIERTKQDHSIVLEHFKNDEEIRRNMQTNIAELISELNSKEKVFREYEAKKNAFVDDISQKRNELENVNYEIKNRIETSTELGKEIEILIGQKREIESNIENSKNLAEEIERKIIRKKEEETSFEEQLNDLKNEISDMEEKKFKIEENILQMESSFADTTKLFAEEISEAKNKLNSIKQLIIDKDREFNKKEQIFLERNTQLAEYTGMVRLLRKEKDSVENKLKDLKTEKELISEKVILLKGKESEAKITIESYKTEIQDLMYKREHVSYELSNLIENSSKAFTDFHNKNQLLGKEIIEKEELIHELTENINDLEMAIVKLKDDISKADMEKEDRSTKIAQLITMEKTFQSKVETYKKELERIEEETIIDDSTPVIKIFTNKKKETKPVENND